MYSRYLIHLTIRLRIFYAFYKDLGDSIFSVVTNIDERDNTLTCASALLQRDVRFNAQCICGEQYTSQFVCVLNCAFANGWEIQLSIYAG